MRKLGRRTPKYLLTPTWAKIPPKSATHFGSKWNGIVRFWRHPFPSCSTVILYFVSVVLAANPAWSYDLRTGSWKDIDCKTPIYVKDYHNCAVLNIDGDLPYSGISFRFNVSTCCVGTITRFYQSEPWLAHRFWFILSTIPILIPVEARPI